MRRRSLSSMAYAPYPPFDSEGKRRKLQQELNSLGGIQIRDEKIDKWPSFKLQILGDEETRAEFFRIIGWTLDQAKEAHAGQTPFPQADPALAP